MTQPQAENYNPMDEEGAVRFSKVEDPAEIERLERGPKRTYYRSMVLIDGKLYPPMSVYVDGKLREPTREGEWMQSDETPFELTEEQVAAMKALDEKKGKGYVNIIPGKLRYVKDSIGGKGTLKFRLLKDNGDYVWAAYNPYFHTSTSGMNDQFSSAWNRPNLVVVAVEIPEEETKPVYKADNSKDPTGDTPWKSGPVNRKLPKERQRTVTLARHAKVVGKVDDSEVAEGIAGQLKGLDLEVPFNVVTPSLREELVKRGVRIGPPEKGNAGNAAIPAYEEWLEEQEGDKKKTRHDSIEFHNIIDSMFDDENFDPQPHYREHYKLGRTPDWMKKLGISGEYFTLSFKNIRTHIGKDKEHDLSKEEWHKFPHALKRPFAVTRYVKDPNRFRLYVDVIHQGKYVAVGVDVISFNQGKGKPIIEINRIKTVFGHRGAIGGVTEELLVYDKNITPEQKALLRGLNLREYPTIQELSVDKDTGNISNSQENQQENSPEGGGILFPYDDAAYTDAVDNGDMETAQRMVAEAAKRAMPETKVVDENGEPMVVYHGTNLTRVNGSMPFWVFYEDSHFGTREQASDSFERSLRRMELSKIYSVYLNIRNPKRVDDVPEDWLETHAEYWEPIIRQAKAEGYDGLVYKNTWEASEQGKDSYVAFYPNQIKSADPVTYDDAGNVIPLEERFDEGKDDIRFKREERDEGERNALLSGVNEWLRDMGLDVIEDVEEGQRVLDEVNRKTKLSRGKKKALETAYVSQEEEHHPTVISSDSGAKILKNLDTLAKNFRKSFKSA